LKSWQPSSPILSLPAQYEELVIALFEHDVLGAEDVLLVQAWLSDLTSIDYKFPTKATHGLYESWMGSRISSVVTMAGVLPQTHQEFQTVADAAIRIGVNTRASVFVSQENAVECAKWRAGTSNDIRGRLDCFPLKVRGPLLFPTYPTPLPHSNFPPSLLTFFSYSVY
jgi:hypothetical protein